VADQDTPPLDDLADPARLAHGGSKAPRYADVQRASGTGAPLSPNTYYAGAEAKEPLAHSTDNSKSGWQSAMKSIPLSAA